MRSRAPAHNNTEARFSCEFTSIGAAMAEAAAPDFNVGAKGSWAGCFFGADVNASLCMWNVE